MRDALLQRSAMPMQRPFARSVLTLLHGGIAGRAADVRLAQRDHSRRPAWWHVRLPAGGALPAIAATLAATSFSSTVTPAAVTPSSFYPTASTSKSAGTSSGTTSISTCCWSRCLPRSPTATNLRPYMPNQLIECLLGRLHWYHCPISASLCASAISPTTHPSSTAQPSTDAPAA